MEKKSNDREELFFEKKNNPSSKFIGGVIAFFIVLMGFLWFKWSADGLVMETSNHSVSESTIINATQLESIFDIAFEKVTYLAKTYESLEKSETNFDIDMFYSVVKNINMQYVEFINKMGDAICIVNGTKIENPTNFSDKEYFIRGIKGETGISTIEGLRAFPFSSERVFGFFTPVHRENEVIGVIMCAFGSEYLSFRTSTDIFGLKRNLYLISKDGKVLLRSSGALNYDNWLTDYIGNVKYEKNYSYEKYVKALSNLEYGVINPISNVSGNSMRDSISFSFKSKTGSYICNTCPIAYENWYLVQTYPMLAVSSTSLEVGVLGTRLLVWIVLTSVGYIIFIILSTNSKTTKAAKEREFVVRAMSGVYVSSVKINLPKNEYITVLKATDRTRTLPDSGEAQENFDTYKNLFVADDSKVIFSESTNLQTIADRIASYKTLAFDYKTKEYGWRRGIFVPVQYDEEGNLTDLIYTVQEIQDEKTQELEYNGIINSLSSIYYYICYIDIDECIYKEISSQPYIESIVKGYGNIYDETAKYISLMVAPSSKVDMEIFMRANTIKERMKKENIITQEYVSNYRGWSRANFIVVNRDKFGSVSKVLFAVQQIDAEKQKELKTQEALKDAYEAANRANNAKSDFLSRMSHDIRTPMNAIIGMTAIASTQIAKRDKVKECLEKINSSSNHLLGLINEVLDMSKIESGKFSLSEENINLSELIDNFLTMIKPQVLAKNHELKINLSNVQHECVIGDSMRIQQIFINMMSNAIKYTPDGGKLSFSISEIPSHQQKIGGYRFVFEDNGIGMSKEFIKQMYEPFSRAEDTRVNKIQGTGLGMSIVNNIVHMMEGSIQVESEENKGTKFTVTIYLKLQDNVDDTIDDFIEEPVLVVDNDKTMCESTCTMLKEIGLKSEYALDSEEAYDKACNTYKDKKEYSVIIVDWELDSLNAKNLIKKIHDTVSSFIPIIIISSYDKADLESELSNVDYDAFVTKPLFKSKLKNAFKGLKNKSADQKEDLKGIDAIENKNYSSKRILLVEDNDINAEIAKEILEMSSLKIERAENGEIAKNMFEEKSPGYYNLIFMDIQMPIMNGYDATKAIRALEKEDAKTIPIVAMTANAFVEDIQASIKVGMNDHISKPLDFTQLAKILDKWL